MHREPSGVRRDFGKLEQRRLEAVELLRQGIQQAEVWQVGVHRHSLMHWTEELKQGGKRALAKPAVGCACMPRICDASRRVLKRGPEALGYETGRWTHGGTRIWSSGNAGSTTIPPTRGGSCGSINESQSTDAANQIQLVCRIVNV